MSNTTDNTSNNPEHVAIIMDGNGRWAYNHGKDRLYGHNTGVGSVREVLTAAQKHKVKFLTLYTFSTENWNRPKDEVDGLMNLFAKTIAEEIEELHENGVRIQFIGNIDLLPDFAKQALFSATEYTKNNTGITLTLALSYSSRWEILNATKRIAQEIKEGKLSEEEVNETLFSRYLTTANIPDPELIIRTSGEFRISNFLLWQIAYSEFYFTDTLWPDFKEKDFEMAINSYQNRERRFGKTSSQINQLS
ncbi:MAG: isoprenyl transferase [Flavobacteriales bacterium]|jgi:undecaprenyl diphosphate synthase